MAPAPNVVGGPVVLLCSREGVPHGQDPMEPIPSLGKNDWPQLGGLVSELEPVHQANRVQISPVTQLMHVTVPYAIGTRANSDEEKGNHSASSPIVQEEQNSGQIPFAPLSKYALAGVLIKRTKTAWRSTRSWSSAQPRESFMWDANELVNSPNAVRALRRTSTRKNKRRSRLGRPRLSPIPPKGGYRFVPLLSRRHFYRACACAHLTLNDAFPAARFKLPSHRFGFESRIVEQPNYLCVAIIASDNAYSRKLSGTAKPARSGSGFVLCGSRRDRQAGTQNLRKLAKLIPVPTLQPA